MTDDQTTGTTPTTTETPTTPTPGDFTLNLEPTTNTPAEPAIQLDFTDFSATTEEYPKIEEINTTPVEETPTILPEETQISPESASITPEETSQPSPEDFAITPAEEAQPSPETTPETNDNRLQTEDQLVQESVTPVEEVTTAPEQTPEPANISNLFVETETLLTPSEEPVTPTEEIQSSLETTTITEESTIPTSVEEATAETPAPVIEEPASNYEKDQQIIANLQNTNNTTPVQTETPSNTTEALNTIPTAPVAPTATGINLDDILGAAPQVPQAAPQQFSNMTNPVTNQVMATPVMPTLAPMGAYMPASNLQQLQQTAPQAANMQKLLIRIGIAVVALIVGGFILKTMYPIQYQNILGNGTGSSETTESSITNTLENTGITAETPLEDTGSIPDESSLISGNTQLEEIHNAADGSGFDAFQDLNQVIESGATANSTIDKEAIKIQLNDYISQGKKARVAAKKTNNKDQLKYGLFLYKKASTLLDSIENDSGITTDEITQQMAQFSGYLEKLTPGQSNDSSTETPNSTDALNASPAPTEPTTPATPTPAEFFGSTTDQTGTDTSTTQNSTDTLNTTTTEEQTGGFTSAESQASSSDASTGSEQSNSGALTQ